MRSYDLDSIVAFRHPDALWVEAEVHSSHCHTVWVLDADGTYYEWRAHLSHDNRWTLSPVHH